MLPEEFLGVEYGVGALCLQHPRCVLFGFNDFVADVLDGFADSGDAYLLGVIFNGDFFRRKVDCCVIDAFFAV